MSSLQSSPKFSRADYGFAAFALVFSLIAVAIIAWILLGRSSVPAEAGLDLRFLPAVNASLNALAAACLTLGWWAVRRKNQPLHQRSMLAAFAMSTLFLLSYLTYHYVHGDTRYPSAEGIDRVVYLVLLASHVILSIPVVPMALFAFYFSYKKQFDRHKKVTKYLAPIWLYVSVTGVLVFLMLRAKLAYG